MANKEHLETLKQGVEAWNRWRREQPDIQPDLSEASIRGVFLRGANLRRTNFNSAVLADANISKAIAIGATFREAVLGGVDFSETDLRKVDFHKANLNGANFYEAYLREANLSGASLWGANLSEATLTHADLSQASSRYTTFAGVNLGYVAGLDTVHHLGPSEVGIHTLYHSKGKIPETFLQGCGLSDIQIEMAKLHNPNLTSEQVTSIVYRIHELRVAGPVQYYSCFISYSHKDEVLAKHLYDGLQGEGVRCWYAVEDMKTGDRIRSRIDESIRIHDKLLLVLSEHSVSSQWVEYEVEHALDLENERGANVLFPIRLDDAVMESKLGWAAHKCRTRHITDFSCWKDHDAYQQAFERLLRDLKAEE